MTSTNCTTTATVIRYLNKSGALVTVESHRSENKWGPALAFTAGCSACLDSYDRGGVTSSINRPREWAAEHSAACRALPQPDTDDRQ